MSHLHWHGGKIDPPLLRSGVGMVEDVELAHDGNVGTCDDGTTRPCCGAWEAVALPPGACSPGPRRVRLAAAGRMWGQKAPRRMTVDPTRAGNCIQLSV